MTPEQVNKEIGRAAWKCWGCKAETGLHWHHGWSVAMCNTPECENAYDEMCAKQVAEAESFEAHCKEYFG